MKIAKSTKPPKGNKDYKKVWRIIDGAVADAMAMHPDYLTPKGTSGRTARTSIVKRVTGAILSYVEQSTQGRENG